MNYIFYQTKTKFSNTGDALINKSLISILRKYGEIKANCSKEIPKDFILQLGISEDERLESNNEIHFAFTIIKYAIKSIFNQNNIYIFSGLGHTYGGSYKKIIRNLIASILFPIYRIFNIHIIRIGISLGPISKGLALTEYMRSLFISEYLVRDTLSLQLCHKIGIKKALLCPDMSWLYMPNTKRVLNNSNTVILNLRNSTLDEYVYDSYINNLISQCIQVLHQINDSMNGQLKVLVTYQVTGDLPFCKELYSKLKNIFNVTFIEKQMSLEDVSKYYGQATYNISNRMHSLLLSYKYGSLPIALIDTKEHIKISATFHDCNISDLLIDVYDKNRSINYIIEHKNELYEKLITTEKKQQNKIITTLEKVLR